ncbi:putative RDD family membrane protein YckC [Christiangramia gaetbulicola]|uniref:Putative RDD family membrane protein YckC n=1 Tax=Christiangramia gaetbulicola TaxID=703340 RepID=A0A2T6AHR9_9FLAO|nr:RDD family protein [Christiangramia gaetbulicola]PTX43373.1 putative RDD family membrane protein YckC [Christiangramia gaetbulicola]
MDNFQIETAQNISIEQNVAGIGERILAFIIDLAIIVVYIVFASLIIAGIKEDNGSLMMYYLVLGLPSFLYYLLWETFWDGRTPGKALAQIRVVKMDGTRPQFSNYLVRWLLRIIDISLTTGGGAVVTILLNGKGQRLGDIAAGTTVISDKRKIGIENTLAVDLPENYQPKYPQVTVLSDMDIQKVKNLYDQARREAQHHVILSLSEKLADLMDVKFEETPIEFVKRVINDYNYYTQR